MAISIYLKCMIWWILGRSPDGFLALGVRAVSEKSQVEASEIALPSPSFILVKTINQNCITDISNVEDQEVPLSPHKNNDLKVVNYNSYRRVFAFNKEAAASQEHQHWDWSERERKKRSTCPRSFPRQCHPVTRGILCTVSSPSQEQDQDQQPSPLRTATVLANRDDGAYAAMPPRTGATCAPQGRHPRSCACTLHAQHHYCTRTSPRGGREKGTKSFLKEIMTSNFPSWRRKQTSRFKKPKESK